MVPGVMLEGSSEILHAPLIFHLVECDRLWAVDVNQNLAVLLVVFCSVIPVRINHNDVLARLENDFLCQERKGEPVSVTSMDELALVRHQHDVEVGRLVELAGVFLAVVFKTVTLL